MADINGREITTGNLSSSRKPYNENSTILADMQDKVVFAVFPLLFVILWRRAQPKETTPTPAHVVGRPMACILLLQHCIIAGDSRTVETDQWSRPDRNQNVFASTTTNSNCFLLSWQRKRTKNSWSARNRKKKNEDRKMSLKGIWKLKSVRWRKNGDEYKRKR